MRSSWDSSVSAVIRLQAGRKRSDGLIPTGARNFSRPALWSFNGNRLKERRREADHSHLVRRYGVSENVPPLPICLVENKIYQKKEKK
jgi:hypothetical protein